MALNEITVFRGDYEFWGGFRDEDLTGNIRFDIYERVQDDLQPYFDADIRQAAFVQFKVFIEVIDFVPSRVQLYGGSPPRYRFGSYTFGNADTYFENKFITYEKQMTRTAKTFIVDGVDSPLTAFSPEAALTLENTWIFLLNDRQTNLLCPVATAFEMELNPSVVVSTNVVYSGQMIFYFGGDDFSLQSYINI